MGDRSPAEEEIIKLSSQLYSQILADDLGTAASLLSQIPARRQALIGAYLMSQGLAEGLGPRVANFLLEYTQ